VGGPGPGSVAPPLNPALSPPVFPPKRSVSIHVFVKTYFPPTVTSHCQLLVIVRQVYELQTRYLLIDTLFTHDLVLVIYFKFAYLRIYKPEAVSAITGDLRLVVSRFT